MRFVNGIRAARAQIVARTDEERVDFLRKRGFSKSETTKVIETVLTEEGRLCSLTWSDFPMSRSASPTRPATA